MAINNGLIQRKMDLRRILLSVSGIHHFAVHELNGSGGNKGSEYFLHDLRQLEPVFWPVFVLAFRVMSREHLFVGRQSDQWQPCVPVYPPSTCIN